MSGLDSLMDGWSMTGSMGKKGSSMNAMKTSGGGLGSSPRGGSTLVPPTSGPAGPSGDDDDIFGLRGGSAAGSPRVAGGGAGGSDLDDIFGLGQMSTATCVRPPPPRALASIAPRGPADPRPTSRPALTRPSRRPSRNLADPRVRAPLARSRSPPPAPRPRAISSPPPRSPISPPPPRAVRAPLLRGPRRIPSAPWATSTTSSADSARTPRRDQVRSAHGEERRWCRAPRPPPTIF
jgi:hypothetical protein